MEDKGRFVAVGKNRWISEKTIAPIDVHVDDSCGVKEAIEEGAVNNFVISERVK